MSIKTIAGPWEELWGPQCKDGFMLMNLNLSLNLVDEFAQPVLQETNSLSLAIPGRKILSIVWAASEELLYFGFS